MGVLATSRMIAGFPKPYKYEYVTSLWAQQQQQGKECLVWALFGMDSGSDFLRDDASHREEIRPMWTLVAATGGLLGCRMRPRSVTSTLAAG